MTESKLQREIMLELSKLGHRVFRNNTGQGWIGAVSHTIDHPSRRTLTISNPRPLHAGLCVGSSDLIGWTRDGRFLAIEVKSLTGRLSEPQRTFLDQVNAAGGIGIVARSLADLVELCR